MPSVRLDELFALSYIRVSYHGRLMGTLARPTYRGITYFAYAEEWLRDGFSISPFSLPLERRVFQTDGTAPDQLFGIFSDSLPDDWGRTVMDRRLQKAGLDPAHLTEFSRLALVGRSGLGALEYEPEVSLPTNEQLPGLDVLARQCQAILDEDGSEGLDAIYRFGSSSGGARPKVMVELDGEPWIVKFPASADRRSSGALEYQYALAARECGVKMSEVRLLPSEVCDGYFATRRFDRVRRAGGTSEKIHMASASALLEASAFDVVDYRDLMRLSLRLTHNVACSEQLYRVMCFNVFAGNCDDHLRNFSFLYNEGSGEWRLSPAYDLTRDDGFMGEHATLVNGKAANIALEDLVAVGAAGNLSERWCRAIARDIEATTKDLVRMRLKA